MENSLANFSYRFLVAEQAPQGVHTIKQVHGIGIADAATAHPTDEADGLFLQKPGSIGVRTADCLPVLLATRSQSGMIMALHAGWRSLAGGIIQEAARVWSSKGFDAHGFSAVLGPTLCSRHFEVGPEVVEAFRGPHLRLKPASLARVISTGRLDRHHIDLSTAAHEMLLDLGLSSENIVTINSCTYCHPERWPSWRRDKHKVPQHIWSIISW